MAEKNSFIVRIDMLDAMETLSDGERGRLFTAMLLYASEEEVCGLTGNEKHVWPAVRSTMQRDMEKYRNTILVRSQAGAKGGRPKKQGNQDDEKAKKANAFPDKQNNPVCGSGSGSVPVPVPDVMSSGCSGVNDNDPAIDPFLLSQQLDAIEAAAKGISLPWGTTYFEQANAFIADHGFDVVLAAIREAADRERPSWKIVKLILGDRFAGKQPGNTDEEGITIWQEQ